MPLFIQADLGQIDEVCARCLKPKMKAKYLPCDMYSFVIELFIVVVPNRNNILIRSVFIERFAFV